MNDLGKPGAGKLHARFDEGRLETEPGLGPAEPAKRVRGQRRTIRPPRQPPTLPAATYLRIRGDRNSAPQVHILRCAPSALLSLSPRRLRRTI
jgi:hypothetical protein